jgi:predicted glutamine amidotransferase
MLPAGQHEQAVIIASEPLTNGKENWLKIPKNHMVIVTPELKMIRPLIQVQEYANVAL